VLVAKTGKSRNGAIAKKKHPTKQKYNHLFGNVLSNLMRNLTPT
jgi:hypothetical protein